MILFIKHIVRSIKRRPLQPILILLTLTLAVSVGITAFRFHDVFVSQADANEQRFAAAGDILITPKKDSPLRMFFTDDAASIVGDRGTVLGEYSLTFFKKEGENHRIVKGAALDLESADAFYNFTYTNYGEFTTINLGQSAVVTNDFAAKYDLTVGDRLELQLFGDDVAFTVQAIAKPTGLLAQRDILIETKAVLRILSRHIPLIGSLGDAFSPCTRLMIHCDESLIEDIATDLQQSEAFADYLTEIPYDQSQKDYFITFQTLLVSILAALILVLCALLILSCLGLLQLQRKDEYALFSLAGASPRQLGGLLYLECFLYGLLGAMLGTLLCHPMLRLAAGLFSFAQNEVAVGVSGVLFGFLFSLFLIFICTFFHLQKKNPREKRKIQGLVTYLVIAVFLFLLLLFLPNRHRYLPAFGFVFFLTALLYRMACAVLQLFTWLLEKRFTGQRKPSVSLLLATKNLHNNAALQKIVRPFALLFALVLTIGICYESVHSQKELIENSLVGEITCVNLPTETKAELEQSSLADGIATYSFISNVKLPRGYSAIAIACTGDLSLCSHPDLIPSPLPQEGEVVLSRGLAYLFEKEVGDKIEMTLQGTSRSFTVVGLKDINSNFIFLSSDSIESSTEITVFKLSPKEENTQRLIAALETDGVLQIEKADIFGSVPVTIGAFLHLCMAVVIISAFISLVGCITLLYQQYHLRASERSVLLQSGATHRTTTAINLVEIGILILIALILALVFGALMAFFIHVGLMSFGMMLF